MLKNAQFWEEGKNAQKMREMRKNAERIFPPELCPLEPVRALIGSPHVLLSIAPFLLTVLGHFAHENAWIKAVMLG